MTKKDIPNPINKTVKCDLCKKVYNEKQWNGKKEFDGYICKDCLLKTEVVPDGEDKHGNMMVKRIPKK